MTYERIEINRDIMDGKPVIRGTRVPVELVLRKLGAGMPPEAILADHPRLTHDDIRAAQAFAADYLADEDIVYGWGVRWLADECVAAPLVALLRVGGHDVLYVAESAAGFSEADVIALALHEKRLLLTEDKDFGDLVFRREHAVPGVVLMRIGPENVVLRTVRLTAAIERYGEELFGRYVVIEEGRFRSRPLYQSA
jgi:uncharacterized protein (DUF433 family)/predicted nuclease of predicted toxin-antitoxin system